jgi:PAS domain S-box-containing protein
LDLLRRTWVWLAIRALPRITPTALAALACALWILAVLLIVQKLSQGHRLLRRLGLSPEQQQQIDGYLDGTLLSAFAITLGGACLVLVAVHLSRQHAALASHASTIAQLRTALDQAAAAEAARQESLSQLRLVIEQLGISVWEWDLVRNELRPTEGADSIPRLGVSKCSGTEFAERFVHPDDRASLAATWRAHLSNSSGKDRIAHRYRLLHVDGSTRHVVFHAQIVRDAEGRAVRARGVDCEVTFEVEATLELQKQAEQLRAAERRLERASRSSLEGHWEGDMSTGRMWMSSSLLALFGYDESMQFMDWKEYADTMVHPDDRKQYQRVLREHLEHGAPYQMRVRFRRSDGAYQWTALHGALERDADGKQLRMAGSSRNVHEQQLAELELQAMQARFERAIQGTRDGLFDLDLQTRKSWVSPRLWELLGHDPTSMPREIDDPYRYVHPADVMLLEAALQGHCEQGLPYDIEYRMRHRSGDWLWVRSRATAERGPAGVALRLSGSVHDISEARAAREALIRATQGAEAANRAKSTFLATMSHEIRTPMNGLIGMTDLLLDTPLERTQRDYVQTIRASSDSLLAIINDVLDFTKIEAGKLLVERIEMDLRSLVDDVAAVMALQAAAKNVELIIDVHGEVPERVLGDPQRIRQCLSNLLGNAVKFTTSGEVLVEVSRRTTEDGAALICFTVRDTGIGMSPEAAAKLFQPFVQADSSTTRKFGGTGLGLSIVKRLVEVMGGQVGLESEAGVGSTFWFSLPLAAAFLPDRAPAAMGGHTPRILIVDDNASQRRVIANQLAHGGYECVSSATADTALATLRSAVLEQRAFAGVLIDRHLEGMDGEQLGRQIVADAQLAELHMVLLTAVDGGSDRKRFEELGFAAYLTKPLRAGELRACLGSVLAHPARGWHLRTASLLARSQPAGPHETYVARVLLVEDNAVNQKVAQKFLERCGCSVLIAPNGAEAVSLYERERFDLILMDMEMPLMDGTTATRHIRELEAASNRRTPIVALTANALTEQIERCMQAGMDAFLSKPIEPARLREVLARYLNGQVQKDHRAVSAI